LAGSFAGDGIHLVVAVEVVLVGSVAEFYGFIDCDSVFV
jgi:hypothetical protein